MLSPDNFQKKLKKICPSYEDKKYLLAVSGGADSMVLASLFKMHHLKFEVAHINYKLRGADSDLDQKLVEDFCKKHQIKLHLYEVSEKDKKPENSVQLWARNLRYAFFFKILEEEKLDFIVTAHHLNDEVETFIINLSRGSGIKGLSGIPANENRILRPLLSFSKKEIYAFAKENHIEFREDLSNQKNDYLRNKIRNQVILKLEDAEPNFLENFANSISYLQDANTYLQNETEKYFTQILKENNDGYFVIDRIKFLALPPYIITEIIRRLGFSGEEIPKVIHAENGKMFRSKTHEIHILRNEIRCVERAKK